MIWNLGSVNSGVTREAAVKSAEIVASPSGVARIVERDPNIATRAVEPVA